MHASLLPSSPRPPPPHPPRPVHFFLLLPRFHALASDVVFPSKPSFHRSFRLSSPPTPPFLRKFRVSFAALRRRYIPNHPYLSAYAIRASYIPARVPVENVLRSTVQFVQVPETFVSDVCLFHWGEEKKAEKKKKKEKMENKDCSRICLQTIAPEREREREFFIFLHLVLIRIF